MFTHLFLDVDRTITNSHKQITQRTKQAILEAQAKGYQVALCTGRQWLFLDYLLPPLSLFPPKRQHVFSGGAQIYTSERQIIWEHLLAADLVRKIFAAAAADDVLILSTKRTQTLINQEAAVEKFVQNHPVDPQSVIFTPACDQELSLLNCHQLTPTFLEFLDQNQVHYKMMHSYQDEVYVDLTADDVNKGTAVETWAQLNQISLGEVAMVGDSENDLEALQTVGNPFIMGNAVPALKNHHFPTLGDTDQDGLAIWLENLPPIA